MGNGFVSRTRRQVVETVRERVHTDVTEIVPVGGAHAARLSPGGDPNWLNRQLAQQVHDKFEDMVRRTPNPTRAERSSYEELLRSFPSAGSNRLRLGPADGAGGGAPDSNAWSGGGGGDDGTYASAPWMSTSARERARRRTATANSSRIWRRRRLRSAPSPGPGVPPRLTA